MCYGIKMNRFFFPRPERGSPTTQNLNGWIFRKIKITDFIRILREPKNKIGVIHSTLKPAMLAVGLAAGQGACHRNGTIRQRAYEQNQ